MRIAATADLHYTATQSLLKEQLSSVRNEADVLIVAGDLTNFGQPSEMEPLLNVLVRLRLPIIAVLGNHDYESGRQEELMTMMTSEGIKVLDGTGYERDGVGFAGTKGFVGGFGRGVLTAFGETEIKTFVKASVDEAMKLLRDAIASKHDYADAHYQLGKVLVEKGALGDAIDQLESAVNLDPSKDYVHYQLSIAYRRVSRTDDANRELKLYQELKAKTRNEAPAGMEIKKDVP